jgi:hypothetical protein
MVYRIGFIGGIGEKFGQRARNAITACAGGRGQLSKKRSKKRVRKTIAQSATVVNRF